MSDYHGHLPEELLIDILSRLPVKPLLRFRCVSKSWRSLISSPSFVNTYLSRMIIATNTSNIDLLLVRHHTQLPDKVEQHYSLVSGNETLSHHVELDFPFRSFNRYFRVVGSCNGLICLSDDLGSVMNTIILWNPTIKKWVTLPLPRFECPDEYSQVLGFGYDPKTNDYKVVRLAYLNWEDSPKVELYSFRKGYWGSISSPLPPPDAIRYLSYPAFVNGAVNWLASEERMYCQLTLSFSMEDELFCEIKLPESLVEEFMPDMCIDVFGESLALFHYDIRTTIEVCTIWVMKEYKVVESWTKLFNIVLGESLVFGIRRNSELLLATRDGKVTLYDPKTQQRNDIGLHGTPGSFCVHSYLPSLVLLDEANGVQGAQYVLEGSSEGTSSLGEEGGGNGENTDMEGSNKE